MKPGDLYTYTYERDGQTEVLVFEVPDFLTTAKVRAKIMGAQARSVTSELTKRHEAHDRALVEWLAEKNGPRPTLDYTGVPDADWQSFMENQIAAFPETLALLRSHTVAGEARPVEAMGNDVERHDYIRRARAVLFLRGGHDADNGTAGNGRAPQVGGSVEAPGEGSPVPVS